MNLTDQQKKYIKDILDSKYFKETLYKGLEDKTKRDELGQFYTPADVCITMIEMYKTEEFSGKNILDPCCGSGNLLIAMLAAGADSDKLYGNDYDEAAVKICRTRINAAIDKLNEWNAYGINNRKYIEDWQIHQGNALHEFALKEFRPDYEELYFDSKVQLAARNRLLNNERYDAYKDSATFIRLHKAESDAKRSADIDKSLKDSVLFGGF